jgi:hypothetical protein
LITGTCAYELDLRQFHSKHRRPLLALGAERCHVNIIKFKQNVIAVRPAHREAANELDSSNLGKTILEGPCDRLHIGSLELNRRQIPHSEIARRTRDPAVRFAAYGIKFGYDLGSPRYYPGAH